jgi:hypothetical protein
MKVWASCVLGVLGIVVTVLQPARADQPMLDEAAAARFAHLALTCLHQEYPNKIAHLMASDADALPPHILTPAFYGCFDWHSAVHGHWLLVRLMRLFPDAPFAKSARAALAVSLIPQNIDGELEYLRRVGHSQLKVLLVDAAQRFYRNDRNCPLAYEPSGQDFLSPCLAEADFMRRVLEPEAYSQWLTDFLPQIPTKESTDWLPPAVITDRADPKLAHLDGLNLSRAWMLSGIAQGLKQTDKRIPALRAAAASHSAISLPAVTGEHYEGGHWCT